MKTIRFILIQIIALFALTMPCFCQSKGEIVAKNGIYAVIELNQDDDFPITMNMFFSDGDTIHISMDNIKSKIKSILKDGEFISVTGESNTLHAFVDVFGCTPTQSDEAKRKLNVDLGQAELEDKFELKGINNFDVVIKYTKMQALCLKTTKKNIGGTPVNSYGIPLKFIPKEYLILLAVINTDKPDEINVQVVD